MNHPDNNEFDLFEFFEMISRGKWLIGAFVGLGALIGFGYSQVSKTQYEVSVPHTISIYSVSSQQTCTYRWGQDVRCLEAEAKKRFSTLLGGNWSSNFTLRSTAPLEVNEYEAQIERANIFVTDEIYSEATAELAFIQTELPDALLSSERVANNLLNAKRLIRAIDGGQSAIAFGSVSIVENPRKVPLILALSVVLGGMVGIGFIFVRNAIKKRKEQMTKA